MRSIRRDLLLAVAAGSFAGAPHRALACATNTYVEWSSPTHVVAGQPFTVRVHGTDMASVLDAYIFDPDNYLLDNHQLMVTHVDADNVDLTDPAGRAPKQWSIAIFGSAQVYTTLFVSSPLPVVSSVTPSSVTSESGATIAVTGTSLDLVTNVYLEGSGKRQLKVNALTHVSGTSLTFSVPRGLEPDSYVVRALDDGGMSLDATNLAVTAAPFPAPTVGELAPTAGFTNNAVVVAVHGKNLTGVTSVVAKGGTSTVNCPFLFSNDQSIAVQIPSSIAPDVYDILVTTANGANLESTGKYVAINPSTVFDYFGDGMVARLNPDTVLFSGSHFGAVVKQGRLVSYLNYYTNRTVLTNDGSDPFQIGIHWDTPTGTKDDAVTPPSANVTLAGLAANAATHGVDFVWKYKGTELFRTTWSLSTASGELEARMSWDTHDDPRLGNANGAELGGFGSAPGTRLYTAMMDGCDFDWYALPEEPATPPALEARWARFPGFLDEGLTFVADPAGGGVLIDQSALEEQCAFTNYYARARSGRNLRFWSRAGFHELHLHSGSLGPVKFRVTGGNWADAVESVQAAVVNPLQPAWFSNISHVLYAFGMKDGMDPGITTQRIEALYQAIDAGGGSIPGSNDWRLLFAFGVTSTGNDNLPDWTATSTFKQLGGSMQAGGWKVLPYIATPGVAPANLGLLGFTSYRLASWDVAKQQIVYSQWGNNDGVDDPGEYWNMNVAHQPYRNTILANVTNSMSGAGFVLDGIFFDFMKGNIPLDDRNLSTGDAPAGLVLMGQEFANAFGTPAHPFAIAGEGSSAQQTKAGFSFALTGVNALGDLETDPLGGVVTPAAYAHPIGTHVTRAKTKTFSSHGSPVMRQIEHYLGRLEGTITGEMPTATLWTAIGLAPINFTPETARALTQIAEEGFYWRQHGVAPWTDPSTSWSDPEVLRVYAVDGSPVARTKDWFVRKLVCDLYWQFGGRAPTQTEFDVQVAKTKANSLSIAGAVSEVRQKFQLAPTPDANIESRPVALQKIVALFPGYPKP